MITCEQCVASLVAAIQMIKAEEDMIRLCIKETESKSPVTQWDIAKQDRELKEYHDMIDANNEHIEILLELAELLEKEI